MSRRKSFVYDMYPQDFNDGVKGLAPATIGIYAMLINLMRVEGGPLPPRRLDKRRDEFDEWIRDKLNLKNVKTWLKAKAELLKDPDKLVELPDGRVANPRTERDLEKRRGGGSGGGTEGGDGGQGTLRLVSRSVDEPVEAVGELAASPDDLQNIGGSSAEVLTIRAANPLILADFRCVSSYPYIRIPLWVAAAESRCRARARDGPAGARAGP